MIDQKLFFLFALFLLPASFTNAQSKSDKPAYSGYIEYTKGNFGSFDYPQKGDSIWVFIKDSSINFQIFPPNAPAQVRSLEIIMKDLKLVKKKMYENIITPTKTVPSGNYDVKFEMKKGKSSGAGTLYLTHYGSGDIAELTLVIEHYGVRLDDLFSATLVKLK